MEPGLSSPATFRHWRGAAVRPTDGIGMEDTGRARQVLRRERLKKAQQWAIRAIGSAEWRGSGFNERAQGEQRRGISDAVNARLPEVTLKCRDHLARGVVISAGFRNPVAVGAQGSLKSRGRLSAVAGLEARTLEIERGSADPVTNARFTQQSPRKFFARILFARRRYIGMTQNTVGTDRPASGNDRLAERDARRNLTQRKVAITEFMTGVDDFDADRSRIDVGLTRPG